MCLMQCHTVYESPNTVAVGRMMWDKKEPKQRALASSSQIGSSGLRSLWAPEVSPNSKNQGLEKEKRLLYPFFLVSFLQLADDYPRHRETLATPPTTL